MPENIIFMELSKKQFCNIYLQNIHKRRKQCYKLLSAMDYFHNRNKNVCHAAVCG